MKCTKVQASRDALLDPANKAWSRVPGQFIEMGPTPLANQPSEYVKVSRDERQIGKVRSLLVQAAHNGTDIFFRLTWEDANRNVEVTENNQFPDACGILLPLNGGDPPIDEMGSREAPVNAWYWRADFDKPKNVIAHGLGTTEYTARSPLEARAVWGHGAWAVVLARPLAVPELKDETAQLAGGTTTRVGFAVWEGSNGERAGIKSFSREWLDLVIEA